MSKKSARKRRGASSGKPRGRSSAPTRARNGLGPDQQAASLLAEVSALIKRGEYADAKRICDEVFRLEFEDLPLRYQFGLLLLRLEDAAKAKTILEQVVPEMADDPEAHAWLGLAHDRTGAMAKAEQCFRRSLALKPDSLDVQRHLARSLREQGLIAESVAAYQAVLEQHPQDDVARQQLLGTLHYSVEHSRADIHQALVEWGNTASELLVGAEQEPLHHSDRTLDRPLRVGFVSSAFRQHPVGILTVAALEAIDSGRFELYAYDGTVWSQGKPDWVGKRFTEVWTEWRSILGRDPEAIAQMIADDRIDVLVDLTDHLAGGGLGVFARRPAPILVKWVGGQINTTGLPFFDYFLSDKVENPPEDDRWYVEQIVRLPDGYVCYAPPSYAPPVAPLPALRNGYVTFGCFNNTAKLNAHTVALWAELLRRVPRSRLILKYKGFGDPAVVERYHEAFQQHGIESDRLDIRGWSAHKALLATYNEVDIALDPYPYSGGLTTCEALWMGVPVITRPGPTFAGRHSATHLTNAGLVDWIVDTDEEYLVLAERWAGDLYGLARLRRRLRQQMASSPLVDGERFARHLEAALEGMWRRWCDRETAAAAIEVAPQPAPAVGEDLALQVASADSALDALLLRAFEQHAAGEAGAALATCQEILSSDPEHAGAYHLSGVMAAEGGKLEMAEGLLRRAVEGAPEVPEYFNSLGFILYKLGKEDDAEAHFREALRLQPGHADAEANLAALLGEEMLHVDEDGREPADLPVLPTSPVARDSDECRQLVKSICAHVAELCDAQAAPPPRAPELLHLHGLLRHVAGRPEEALEYLQAAVQAAPANAGFYESIASVLRQRELERQ